MSATRIRGDQIKNASIALAKLDTSIISGGKLLDSLLPASIIGAMAFQDTWDAAVNTPTIPAAASGNKGWYYIVGTAGTTTVNGESDWQIGDWIVSNGASWSKIDNTEKTETAATTSYDNTTSNLAATTVQGAIDEVEGRVDSAEHRISLVEEVIPVTALNCSYIVRLTGSALSPKLSAFVEGAVFDDRALVAGDALMYIGAVVGGLGFASYVVASGGAAPTLVTNYIGVPGTYFVTSLYRTSGGTAAISHAGTVIVQVKSDGTYTQPIQVSTSDAERQNYRTTTEQITVDAKLGQMGLPSNLTTTIKTTLVDAINELHGAVGGAASAGYRRETPAGAVDGVNAGYALTAAPVAGTLQVYLNGQLQEPTDDYTLAGTTVTMVGAPLVGDKVRCIYLV